MPRRGTHKYEPLRRYLAVLPPEVEVETLTIPAIETLLGGPLPPSAWRRPFWRNSRPAARVGWRPAGWWVYAVDLTPGAEAVSFVRVGPPRD